MVEPGLTARGKRLAQIVFIGGILPTVVTVLAGSFIGVSHKVLGALHPCVELMGTGVALMSATLLIMRSQHEKWQPHHVWVAAGLTAMGIGDGAHGVLSYGIVTMWLRQWATLAGGVFFALTWAPLPPSWQARAHQLLFIVLLLTGVGIGFVLWRPDLMPAWPVDAASKFTPIAKAVNIAGGLGFVAAAAFFARLYLRQPSQDDLLFVGQSCLFGTQSLLVGLSVWNWWAAHGFRLLAYCLLLRTTHRLLTAVHRQMAEHARELERRVEERTAALQTAESRLRTLTDNLHEAAIFRYRHEADGEPALVFVSAGIERLTGSPAASFLAQPGMIRESLPPEDDCRFVAATVQSREQLTPFEIEVRRKHRVTAEIRWSLLRATPLRDREGATIWDGIELDITDRKRAEQALRESDERQAYLLKLSDALRSIGDAAEIMAAATRILGEHLGVNRAYYAEAVSDGWLVANPYEQGVDRRLEGRHSAAKFGEWIPGTFRDGQPLVICDVHEDARFTPQLAAYEAYQIRSIVGMPLVKEGRLAAILAVQATQPRDWQEPEIALVEETLQRTWAAVRSAQAEAALQESEQRYRATFDNAAIGIAHVGMDGRWLRLNQAVCRITGYPREELAAMTFQDVTHPEDREGIWLQAERVWAGSLPTCTRDGRYIRKDGGLVWVRVTVSLLRDAGGEPFNLIAVIEDIDDRVRAEMELRAANHDLEQFAYSASHDLKEPLRNVAIYSELLRDRYKGKLDAQADKFLHFILEGSKRMGMLVSDLLSYVESTQFDDEPVGRANTEQVLEHVLMNLERAIRESSAVVTHDCLPDVAVKEFHLQQLLQNLIGNSIKYRKDSERPRVHVSATPEGGWWRFSVRDNGIGIAPEFHHKVFGLFKRLHTRSSKYGGTGIGLAICQKVVERYGSRIWLESAPEQGTVVHFTLPRGAGGT